MEGGRKGERERCQTTVVKKVYKGACSALLLRIVSHHVVSRHFSLLIASRQRFNKQLKNVRRVVGATTLSCWQADNDDHDNDNDDHDQDDDPNDGTCQLRCMYCTAFILDAKLFPRPEQLFFGSCCLLMTERRALH